MIHCKLRFKMTGIWIMRASQTRIHLTDLMLFNKNLCDNYRMIQRNININTEDAVVIFVMKRVLIIKFVLIELQCCFLEDGDLWENLIQSLKCTCVYVCRLCCIASPFSVTEECSEQFCTHFSTSIPISI